MVKQRESKDAIRSAYRATGSVQRAKRFRDMRQVRDDDLCCGEMVAFVVSRRHSDAEAAAFVRTGDVDRRVADGDRALCRPIAAPFAPPRTTPRALKAHPDQPPPQQH